MDHAQASLLAKSYILPVDWDNSSTYFARIFMCWIPHSAQLGLEFR